MIVALAVYSVALSIWVALACVCVCVQCYIVVDGGGGIVAIDCPFIQTSTLSLTFISDNNSTPQSFFFSFFTIRDLYLYISYYLCVYLRFVSSDSLQLIILSLPAIPTSYIFIQVTQHPLRHFHTCLKIQVSIHIYKFSTNQIRFFYLFFFFNPRNFSFIHSSVPVFIPSIHPSIYPPSVYSFDLFIQVAVFYFSVTIHLKSDPSTFSFNHPACFCIHPFI